MSPANTEVIKEPRGFIKFLEIVIAICAFATTTSHYTSSYLQINCLNDTKPVHHTVALPFGYPYKLYETSFNSTLCTGGNEPDIHLYGNYKAPAEFYVFVGVMAFLYSLAALGLYVFGDEQYRQNENVPVIDFFITLVFGALWLIASSVWADSVSQIKHYTNPNDLILDPNFDFPECHTTGVHCVSAGEGNFASLNVSIIFGFLNMVLWLSNLWFLYKETKWFKPSKGFSPDHASPDTPQQM